MIINQPHLCTRMEVWNPKWSTKFKAEGEPVALLHKRKVDFASPTIIVEFTRSPALRGQRFAIKKSVAQSHPLGDNGSAPMYCIPMSHFESYETGAEVMEIVNELFPE